MSKRDVQFNIQAFWESVLKLTKKRKLKGALANLEQQLSIESDKSRKEALTTIRVWLLGKIGNQPVTSSLVINKAA